MSGWISRKRPPSPSQSHEKEEEFVNLVASYLDPKSVAIASCICKSWNKAMSSEDLWRDLCKIHYPSLAAVAPMDHPVFVTYRRLCAMGFTAFLRRHKQVVPKIRISIDDLIFNIAIKSRYEEEDPIITLWKPSPCLSTEPEHEGRFMFDIETNPIDLMGIGKSYVVTWIVFFKGWRGMFMMMDSARFSISLMPQSCTVRCSSTRKVFAICETKAHKVTVGMRSLANSCFLTVDEGLRFLQHFLLPFPVVHV